MSDKPTCYQCGAEISRNKTIMNKFGIKEPLEPDECGKHTCEEQRKIAFKTNQAANDLATKDAREKATSMVGNSGDINDLTTQLRENSILLKWYLDESRRTNDLFSDIRMQTGNIDFNTKKGANSHEWFEKLLEVNYKNDEIPPRGPKRRTTTRYRGNNRRDSRAMTSSSIEKKLLWITKNVTGYQAFEESKRLDEETSEYRLKKYSTEIPKIGGVRD